MKANFILKGCLIFTFILVVTGACSIPFFFESPSLFYKFGMDKTLLRMGKIFGILAGVLLICQLLYTARFSFLDKVFGQDRLLLFHRWFALLVLLFVLLHPVFILWAEGFSFYPLEIRYWPVFLGITLLFGVIFMVILSYFRSAVGMKWNNWIAVHRIIAPFIMAGLAVHVFKVSKSFENGLPNILLWGSAFFILIMLIKKWVLHPAVLSKKYRVTSIKPGAKDAWVMDIKTNSDSEFEFLPGQFAYVTIVGKNIDKEEHPFTIASAPEETGSLQFVIRACGDFTRQIFQVEPGDTVRVDGPYGRFSHFHLEHQVPMVMIAGGIGITPMLSMLRSMAVGGDKRKILLVWSNKTQAHIFFKKEFDHFIDKLPGFSIHHVISRDFKTGEPETSNVRKTSKRLNQQMLESLLQEFSPESHLFLCGPPPMVSSVKKMLKTLGFHSCRVYTELFVL